MAKKVVATLKDKTATKYAKVIRAVKNEATGAYSFKEEMVEESQVKEVLNRK